MELDSKLLEILACPKCKGNLELSDNKAGLVCNVCRLEYPIKDGIPVMLLEEAKKLGN